MIVKVDARVILSGIIGQDCINQGGRLAIDSRTHVGGKLIRNEDNTG